MAEWLAQASQWHEMYCHDLDVMSSNPSRVELGVHSTSVLSRIEPQIIQKKNKYKWIQERYQFILYLKVAPGI